MEEQNVVVTVVRIVVVAFSNTRVSMIVVPRATAQVLWLEPRQLPKQIIPILT